MAAGLDPWPAPAKLNRFLRITGRRADGYHTLQTAFQFLDRADQLWFEPAAKGTIARAQPLPGVDDSEDLCLRAARLLAETVGDPPAGVLLRLDKRLPVGAGLGGGSSNAATTLVALNYLWGCGLPPDRLAELGLRLGADVPVFIIGRAAWAEGVGERLTPLDLNRPWFAVLVPDCQVATAAVFNDPQLTRDAEPLTMRADLDTLGNDCEAVVLRRYPPVARAFEWLARYARPRLTGTGCCVFAQFAERAAAEAVVSILPPGLSGFVSRGHNRSLLQDRLQRAKIAPCG